MLKKNKWKLLLSSLVILLPILFGLMVWNKLPGQMTTHWGPDGNADGWSPRYFAVFALPIFILAAHWLCIFCTMKDPKNKNQNNKVFGIVFWVCPITSLFANGLVYFAAFGKDVELNVIISLLMGLLFVGIGNYLPKCKQNFTIGIRIKRTLENEENWNATHRFCGKIWVAGGMLLMVCAFLPEETAMYVLIALLLALAVLPILYSYWYHKKQIKEGTAVITSIPKSKASKLTAICTIGITAAILAVAAFMMFTGDIDIVYGDTSFTMEASYWNDLTVEYDAIDQIEYRETDHAGERTNGLGSARLLAGAFRNAEFGNYTRYSYIKCKACVVLTVGGRILVINGPDIGKTKEIYETLQAKVTLQ